MAKVTKTHKAVNDSEARYWLLKNKFQLVNGNWMDDKKRWARCELMPSGKILIKVGVV